MRQIFPPQPGTPERGQLGPVSPLTGLGRLTPDRSGEPGVRELADEIAAVYAYPDSARPWVRANMVQSADGAVSIDDRSAGLSGVADRFVFSVLRSLADVIVVGASTARSERYGKVRRHEVWPGLRQGRPPTPVVAVVTRRIDLDLDGRLVTGWPPSASADPGPARTIVLTTRDAPLDRQRTAAGVADVILAGDHEVTARAAVDALAARGHRRILVEGGPGVLGMFAAEDMLDEVCLTISPLLEGGHAGRITALPSGGRSAATRLVLATLLEDDSVLLARYRRAEPG